MSAIERRAEAGGRSEPHPSCDGDEHSAADGFDYTNVQAWYHEDLSDRKARLVVGGAPGAGGEMTKVTQVFQPDGRFSAANSPYAFKLR